MLGEQTKPRGRLLRSRHARFERAAAGEKYAVDGLGRDRRCAVRLVENAVPASVTVVVGPVVHFTAEKNAAAVQPRVVFEQFPANLPVVVSARNADEVT